MTARPIDQLTLNGDVSIGYNNASYTRVDPRQVQSYKVHATYKPKMWAVLDGAAEIHENRDDVSTVSNLEHDRSYSFTTTLMPNSRLAVSFGYNYWNVYNQAEICFNYSVTYTNPAPPPSTLPGHDHASGRGDDGVPNCRRFGRGGRLRGAFDVQQHRPFCSRRTVVEAGQASNGNARIRRKFRARQLDPSQSAHAFGNPRLQLPAALLLDYISHLQGLELQNGLELLRIQSGRETPVRSVWPPYHLRTLTAAMRHFHSDMRSD